MRMKHILLVVLAGLVFSSSIYAKKRRPRRVVKPLTPQQMMEMIYQYQPLTDDQIKRQTDEDKVYWKEVGELKVKMDALSANKATPAEWNELRLQLEKYHARTIRPSGRESAAPYTKPATPETRDLTKAEEETVLKEDWLFQASGKPSLHLIRNEIKWAREVAARIGVDCKEELEKLSLIEKQVPAKGAPNKELYFQVRSIKRAIMFKNPVIDFSKMVFVDMERPRGSEWNHETKHREGYMAIPTARLLTLEGLSPSGKVKQIMPQKPLHGSFWRPDVSWDGTKILFCYQPHNEKSFHIYEINADGTNLRQITSGPYDDLDPIYLPDGKNIMFSSTRANTYVRCMPPTNSYVLSRCDLDGKNIYIVSRNSEPDYLPTVMNDGKVIYTRWEYTDKALWRAQGLWSVNPDGTQVNHVWGQQGHCRPLTISGQL